MPRKPEIEPMRQNPPEREKAQRPAADVLWGRPIFKAPSLPNPRIVYDPQPFRTQLFSGFRTADQA
jgi:hypothetical protein